MKRIVLPLLLLVACVTVCLAGKTATPAQIATADKALIAETDSRRTQATVATHLPWGIPVQPPTATREHLLCQPDYLINYDDNLRVPIWTAYRLRFEDLKRKQTRLEAFRRDPRLEEQEKIRTAVGGAESAADQHFGLASWVRNSMIHQNANRIDLFADFQRGCRVGRWTGQAEPDDVSGVIVRLVWERLREGENS
jgi:hypothetical protein